MRKILHFLLVLIFLTSRCFAQGSSQEGTAAKEGKANAATIAWAVAGVGFFLAVGIAVAIAIHQDKNKIIVVQH